MGTHKSMAKGNHQTLLSFRKFSHIKVNTVQNQAVIKDLFSESVTACPEDRLDDQPVLIRIIS